MKLIKALYTCAIVVAVAAAGCDKKEDLPYYGSGTAPVLASATSTLTPAPADSLRKVLAVSWTNPGYATNAASNKYIIEIDSAGKNFTNPYRHTVNGALADSFTAKELNTLLLNWDYTFYKNQDLDIRVISFYGNNNNRLSSNTIRVRMTSYRIPPKIALPASNRLFIVGGATPGGWSNPVPVPSQELTRVDSVTFGITLPLSAGGEYLLLPVNGDWTNKYAVANTLLAGLSAGGDFGYNLSSNFPAPAIAGTYRLRFNFQTGKFTAVRQ